MEKKIITGVCIGLLLFLVCCVSDEEQKILFSETTIRLTTPIEFCSEIGDSFEKNKCLAIINNESESFCESASPDVMKGPCYIDFAIAEMNQGICEEAGESRDSCYLALMLETSDSSFCDKIESDTKDRCYKNAAQETGDYSLCANIESDELRIQCMSEDNATLEGCDAGNETDYCILNAAVIEGSPAKCAGISELGTRKRCIQITSSSGEECQSIPTRDSRDVCYGYVAEKTMDEQYCYSVEDDTRKYECFFAAARSKNDPSLCELIEPEVQGLSASRKNYCYYHAAIANTNSGVCAKIKQTSMNQRQSDMCYYHAGLRLAGMDRVKSYSVM